MVRGRDILEESREREKQRERELQNRFNADSKDIIAFSLAAWQLFIPVIVALLIVGLLVMFILNLF
ncbi:MAG: hypothetical protein HXS48_07145 [Theionarchaea archaeon]|nr:MAG: hypothetical protein AYK19_10085 [Theionarchaea archaeon DG-70-1]MBU7026702.1 hypothetical protein [Theionarchaea archaeon]